MREKQQGNLQKKSQPTLFWRCHFYNEVSILLFICDKLLFLTFTVESP